MGKPAARVGDMHVCPMVTPGLPPIPHVGGPILPAGVPTVLVGNMPAAVLSNMCTCVGPPDSIILGSMGVMIGGMPAARMGDSTAHGGSIVMGLPTVLIGETSVVFGAGPLSLEQAQLLFQLMANQGDIAFAYPIDGCYARAHIMTQRMAALGVTPKGKAWTFGAPPDHLLRARTTNDPSGYVEWGYHVAPVIQVRNASGGIEDRVIDPSLFDHPVTPEQWRDAQSVGTSQPTLVQTAPGEAPIPSRGGSGYWPAPDPPEGADTAARETMEEYKIKERTSKNSYHP